MLYFFLSCLSALVTHSLFPVADAWTEGHTFSPPKNSQFCGRERCPSSNRRETKGKREWCREREYCARTQHKNARLRPDRDTNNANEVAFSLTGGLKLSFCDQKTVPDSKKRVQNSNRNWILDNFLLSGTGFWSIFLIKMGHRTLIGRELEEKTVLASNN